MDYLPQPGINIVSSIDKLNHYKKIFAHNKKKDNTILLLKKKEFDIFYSCKRKYPLLVAETITSLTGKTDPNEPPIDRRDIEDPFREDIEIPPKYQHTLNDYLKYMEYGGSMGHNAPAGQHKTNLEIYYETFLLSNITPQEMVFNSGLWVLMENWCKYLGKHNGITNIRVMTGSIPESHPLDDDLNRKPTNRFSKNNEHNFNGVKMNIPNKMFKIVCFELINKPGITFLEILIANNSAYYISPKITRFDLSSYLVPNKSLDWFQNFSGIDIHSLLEYYGFNNKNIKPFRNIISMEINLSPALQKLMKKSNWFGYLIYSPSLSHLEHKWEECKKLEKEFETLRYHEQFYELTKKRLIRDEKHILDLKSFENSSKLFKKKSTQCSTKKTHSKIHSTKTKTKINKIIRK